MPVNWSTNLQEQVLLFWQHQYCHKVFAPTRNTRVIWPIMSSHIILREAVYLRFPNISLLERTESLSGYHPIVIILNFFIRITNLLKNVSYSSTEEFSQVLKSHLELDLVCRTSMNFSLQSYSLFVWVHMVTLSRVCIAMTIKYHKRSIFIFLSTVATKSSIT